MGDRLKKMSVSLEDFLKTREGRSVANKFDALQHDLNKLEKTWSNALKGIEERIDLPYNLLKSMFPHRGNLEKLDEPRNAMKNNFNNLQGLSLLYFSAIGDFLIGIYGGENER